ncbi:PepSY domain-containing protein [Desulfoluna spongiiphila]|uniref:PepSY-associated TM region n=1 Tax=Desulfoluna spongiiphila TaxID=419481 RepID=A0A1G5IYX3_9BACT|nr:PepSY domain-containing protein [Desulfoluna spongiiphila]SCY81276.1 PepSY-associated TM region [Desulfoluna spongiiphila]VVS91814.1 pepsy-associated tm protein [Desulfoluna spongiiphila]
MRAVVLNRKIHRWAAIATALPVFVVVFSGAVLLMKKEVAWIQPATKKGVGHELALSFDEILRIAMTVKAVGIYGWADVDRLDVRPGKGLVKVRARNHWEIQVDMKTGEILQVAVRRSDLIESIHDGSFFHEQVKFWVLFPTAIVLVGVWATGVYLFFFPYVKKRG